MRDPDEPKREPSPASPMDDQPTTPIGSSQSPGGLKGSTPAPPHALEERYEILGEAGRGGMGIVYRARDRETGEIVALKVLKPEIASDTAIIERFKNELRLARKITHKYVCRIHEFNRAADGSAYISMEYVDGDSLRHFLKRFGSMSLRTGVRVAQQICEGLHEAHAQGVVHRDLKPENVMLDQAGNVKVMDFGIARSLETATATVSVLGTPAYMSPEQAEAKTVDQRTDIYALGLILYEIFTGSMAFTGDTPAAIVYKHVHHTPSSPREIEAAIPDHVEKAILKCLEKDPAKRFQSVDELAAALTQKPEFTPAPTQAAGEEVALPIHLSTWQRSDTILAGAAFAGLALFLVLFYRFHPASAMKITVNEQEQKQIALELFKKLNWNVEIGKSWLNFSPEGYYDFASNAGEPAWRRLITRIQAGGSMWYGETKILSAGGTVRGDYYETGKGKMWGASRSFPDVLRNLKPGSADAKPDQTAIAQMRSVAQASLSAMFGSDVVSGAPTEKAFRPPGDPWEATFQWRVPLDPKGVYARYEAWLAEGGQIIGLHALVVTWDGTGWPDLDNHIFLPPKGYVVALPLMVLVVLFFFLVRQVHRQPASGESQYIAALAAALATVAAPVLDPIFGGQPDRSLLELIGLLAGFCVTLLLSYSVLKTALYYLRTRFPLHAAGYSRLFSRRAFEPPTGLASLRGVLAGAAFCGGWMAALSITGIWGEGLAGMLFWLEAQQAPAVEFAPGSALRLFPAVTILEPLAVGWLLVAFPLSLLGKASARWRVLLGALAALWLALGFSLAGPMAFPRVAYYVLAAAQAVFFGWIFLRYGMVSTLSAIFTVETILLAFPLLEIFQHLDPIPYAIPIAVWLVLLALSAGIAFRPQVTGAYRRVAAVFE